MRIGFVALTDAASVLMAEELGLYAARGVEVDLVRMPSWPALRDGLLTGVLDAAHGLFSMPLSIAAGITGAPGQRLMVAMVLSVNGQAITLRGGLAAAGYGSPARAGAALAAAVTAAGARLSLAATYPGGTHDVWLRYWLRAAGVDPAAVDVIPIPPPQMVAHLRAGAIDGYSAGEPWNAVAVQEGIGFTAIASQDIWPHHPEKALLVGPACLRDRRGELAAAMGAILAAAAWLDEPGNRRRAARAIGRAARVDAPASAIEGRMAGRYEIGAGLGRRTFTEAPMLFHRGGLANPPRRRDAIWFLAQYQRLGLVRGTLDHAAIADDLLLRDLYAEVAATEGVALPDDDMDPFTVTLDGARFDPGRPLDEAGRP